MTTERDGMRMVMGLGVWAHRRSSGTGWLQQVNVRGGGASHPDVHDQAGMKSADGREQDPARQDATS
jgi:hypothetical protein